MVPPVAVQVQTKDLKIFSLSKSIYLHILLFADMLEDVGDEHNGTIPLSNITSETFAEIVRLLELYNTASDRDAFQKILSTYHHDLLKRLANGINFLNIPCLTDVIYMRIIEVIDEMTQDEINAFLRN